MKVKSLVTFYIFYDTLHIKSCLLQKWQKILQYERLKCVFEVPIWTVNYPIVILPVEWYDILNKWNLWFSLVNKSESKWIAFLSHLI